MGFIEGLDRGEASLLPPSADDYVARSAHAEWSSLTAWR